MKCYSSVPALAVPSKYFVQHNTQTKMDIATQVKCTVCQGIPGGEIFHCKNTHIICSSCLATTNSCAICSISLVDRFRHLAFESLLDMVDFPCENKALGCTELLKRGELLAHSENNCEFGGVVIQLCKEIGYKSCPFSCKSRQIDSIVKHLRQKHNANLIESSSTNIEYSNFSKIFSDLSDRAGYVGPPMVLKRIGHELTTSFLILPICSAGITSQQKTCSWLCIFLGELSKEGKKFQAEFSIRSLSSKVSDLQWTTVVCCLDNFVPFIRNTCLMSWSLLKEYYCTNGGLTLEIRIQQVATGPIKAKQPSSTKTHRALQNMADGEATSVAPLKNRNKLPTENVANLGNDKGPRFIDPQTNQVVPIVGKYTQISSENFNEYMKAMGVGMIQRNLLLRLHEVATIEISVSGKIFTIEMSTLRGPRKINFELGKDFVDELDDLRKSKANVTMQGNTLVLVQNVDNYKSKITYSFSTTGMTVYYSTQGAAASRTFIRV